MWYTALSLLCSHTWRKCTKQLENPAPTALQLGRWSENLFENEFIFENIEMCIKVCEGCAGCEVVCCQPVRRSSPVCAHSLLSFCFPNHLSRIFGFLEGNVLLSRISGSCSAYRKQTPSVIKQSLYVFPSFLLPSDESEIMNSNSPPPTNC